MFGMDKKLRIQEDISADLAPQKDRGESLAEMEPMLIGETPRFSRQFDTPRRRAGAEGGGIPAGLAREAFEIAGRSVGGGWQQ